MMSLNLWLDLWRRALVVPIVGRRLDLVMSRMMQGGRLLLSFHPLLSLLILPPFLLPLLVLLLLLLLLLLLPFGLRLRCVGVMSRMQMLVETP